MITKLAHIALGAMALMLLPQTAYASMWLVGDGQCTATPVVAQAPLVPHAASIDVSEADDGCDDEDLSDPSSNACFEGAEVPISTLPQLIAEMQAEKIGARLIEAVREDLAPVVAEPSEYSSDRERDDASAANLELRVRKDLPRPAPTELSCSVRPDECKSLPPIPELHLESNGASGERVRRATLLPPPPEPHDEDAVLDGARVGPSSGHERELERPPRVA